MACPTAPTSSRFARDERGTIAITFGILIFVVVLAAGVAVDLGRMLHAQSRLIAASDAAALAAAKALLDGRQTDEEVKLTAQRYFEANFRSAETYGTPGAIMVRLDRATSTVEIDTAITVDMTLTRIAGYGEMTIPVQAIARFDQKDIELSIAVDVTGSMCSPCSKLEALKDATKEVVDILLPDAGTPNKVRIAIAPYSSGVNAGSYATEATNGTSTNGCTFEREGTDHATDAAPAAGAYLKAAGAPGVAATATCPSRSPVIGLTSDKDLLKTTVDGYNATGSTAGHLGAQWASYLVAPAWASLLGTESAPAPYRDGKTIKAVILMTDGANNTLGGRNWGNGSAQARESDARVRAVCDAMRDTSRSILVFTVGFQLGRDANARNLLRDCAGAESRFFEAEDRDALKQAFQQIAFQLNNLRLSK